MGYTETRYLIDKSLSRERIIKITKKEKQMKKAFCSLALPLLLVMMFTTPVIQASQQVQKIAATVSSVVITPTLDPANSDIGSKQSSLNLTATVEVMPVMYTITQVQLKVETFADQEIINQENLAGMITQGTLVTQVTTIEKVEGNIMMVQKNNGAINADVGSVNLLTSTSKNIVGTEAATSITTKMAKVKGTQSRVVMISSSFT